MEITMRANEEIEIGEDITLPLFPISFSLHDSFLSSHCSSCFSLLPPFPFPSPLSSAVPHHHYLPLYCSTACSSSHSPIISSAAESFLPPACPDSSDLRTALRLLLSLSSSCFHLHRFNHALLTNYHELKSSPEFAAKIRQGARAMAVARKLRYGDDRKEHDDFSLEEAVLSLVITNAVEVQDQRGRSLGIAVYDPSFSWINHSCSPNACYRFLVSPPSVTSFGNDSNSRLRIVPSVSREDFGVCSCLNYTKEIRGYEFGPKIIVRSIKKIRKGEEVCVSYTDLLQPKAMRQSDLCFKYQFTCSCSRCSAFPSTYVDHALEEISASNLSFSSSCSDANLHRDEATKMLSDYVDEIITEFLLVGDPESCCEKLENMLNLGLQIEKLESEGEKSQLNFTFHPFHHITLNAYTTLTSAYRIRSNDLLALNSETDDSQLKAFEMNRISAAYSLLVAGATHHLFCSESSLIVSAANFWTNAGESLLVLARSYVWDLFATRGLSISELSTILKHKCSKCSLMDTFDTKLILSEAQRANFEIISSAFLDCVSNLTPKIWKFLVHGCSYLEKFEDPIDFKRLGHVWHSHALGKGEDEDSDLITEDSMLRHHAEWYTNESRVYTYQVLLFGKLLQDPIIVGFGGNCYILDKRCFSSVDDYGFVLTKGASLGKETVKGLGRAAWLRCSQRECEC